MLAETLPFFIVLVVGVIFSALVRRLHVPWVIALIIGGIVIGPYGLELLEPDNTLTFLGQIGLVFLMFMAGLETRMSGFKKHKGKVLTVAAVNGLIPCALGIMLMLMLGYSMMAALVVGIIFISSSVAVIIPALESNRLINTKLGLFVLGTTVIQDVFSLIVLSILLQFIAPSTMMPLPLFYALFALLLVIGRWIIPKIRTLAGSRSVIESEVFQQDLRVVFAILIGTVVIFELMGLHAVIAGFFAGFVLSESIRSELLKQKIFTVSYGIFIPIFFILLGVQTNIGMFAQESGTLLLAAMIIIVSVASKVGSGWLGGRLAGLSQADSLFVGATSIPQLATSLAAALLSLQLGIIDQHIMAAVVALTVVTTMLSPLVIHLLARHVTRPSAAAEVPSGY